VLHKACICDAARPGFRAVYFGQAANGARSIARATGSVDDAEKNKGSQIIMPLQRLAVPRRVRLRRL
jgi:hypothetical protein